MVFRSLPVVLVCLSVLPGLALAHGDEDEPSPGTDLVSSSVTAILLAGLTAAVLVAVSALKKRKSEKQKWALFLGIAIPVILATAYSAASTIALNLTSESGGPVHWHADFEVWNCGQRLDLVDPEGLLNRVGSPVFHEHGDDRIHIEGVVSELEDASLHRFFEFVGGSHEEGFLRFPTNSGMVEVRDGDLCQGSPGQLQYFLLRVTNPSALLKTGFLYQQEKLEGITDYVPAPYGNVPPGDCLIVEFDQPKERTDKMCGTYQLAVQKGQLSEVLTNSSPEEVTPR